jgi:hypothetical protein
VRIDRRQFGPGTLNCGATIAFPGVVESTGYLKLDKHILSAQQKLSNAIHDVCGLDVDSMGFGATLSDPTGAPFTAEDLFHTANDALHTQTDAILTSHLLDHDPLRKRSDRCRRAV